ncbi:MAG: hypothetical protein AB1478_09740 [Nitrospirota bacterium]
MPFDIVYPEEDFKSKDSLIRNEKSKMLAVPCHAELDSASLNNSYFETLKQACPATGQGSG